MKLKRPTEKKKTTIPFKLLNFFKRKSKSLPEKKEEAFSIFEKVAVSESIEEPYITKIKNYIDNLDDPDKLDDFTFRVELYSLFAEPIEFDENEYLMEMLYEDENKDEERYYFKYMYENKDRDIVKEHITTMMQLRKNKYDKYCDYVIDLLQ